MMVFICWCLCSSISAQTLGFGYPACSGGTSYTSGSKFEANLKKLLTFFSSSNASKSYGFYNSTVGDDSPDVVYGVFLCRGDFRSNVCQACVSKATEDIITQCPMVKAAAIWLNECMLRYASQSFFNTNNQTLAVYFANPNSFNEDSGSKQVLDNSLNDLINRATNVTVDQNKHAIRGFATQIVNYTSALNLYELVQCTPDLSGNDCGHCLREATSYLPECCDRKQVGRVFLYSCNIRYEVYPFFNILDSVPSPSPALAPTPTPSSLGKDKGIL